MLFVVVILGTAAFCFVRREPDKRLANIFSALIILATFVLIFLCILDIVR